MSDWETKCDTWLRDEGIVGSSDSVPLKSRAARLMSVVKRVMLTLNTLVSKKNILWADSV